MIHGILNLLKPPGMSSRDLVDLVCQVTRQSRVGHAGTLDPLATGVLVVCCGRATRLVELIQSGTKEYQATFRLGQTSDTDDSTGTVIEHACERWPHRQEIVSRLPSFHGDVWQVPPVYSALKLSGRRAYQLARQGQAVELPPRQIRIDELRIELYDPPHLNLFIRCGSGTYVRSIGRDLGQQLGCGALMTDLIRSRVGPFHLRDAVPVDQLNRDTLSRYLLPLEAAVQELPQQRCTADEARRLRMGQRLELSPELIAQTRSQAAPFIALLEAEGGLVAVGHLRDEHLFQPQIVFPVL